MSEQLQDPDKLANDIVRRANALDISVSELCRLAGVSRRWFTNFRSRTPKTVKLYARLTHVLTSLEEKRNTPQP